MGDSWWGLYLYVFFKESPKIVGTYTWDRRSAATDLFPTCFLELFAKPTATATHTKSGATLELNWEMGNKSCFGQP